MDLKKNIDYSVLVKNQYLPPPLEINYLSLFDIQVKMAKQFLQGTQQEKVNIIKKRIKKFFDYGNQSFADDSANDSLGQQKKSYPPMEVDSRKFKDGLEIDSAKIIVYGKQLSLQVIQKLFHGFLSLQKINDCNYKLEYVNEKVCQSILYQNLREKTAKTTNKVFNPLQIEWFQIQPMEQLKLKQTYARYSTNKDDVLFKNDLYFRRLLGKVRQSYDIKRLKYQNQVKEMQETIQFYKIKKTKKKKHLFKYNQRKNINTQQSQIDTNYDGKQFKDRQFDRSRDYEYNKNKYKKRNDYQRRQSSQKSQIFNNLNLSKIKHTPIEQQKYSYRYDKNNSSLESINFTSKKEQKRGRERNNKQLIRNNIIKQYRQRSVSPGFVKSRNLLQYSYNKDLDKKMQKFTVEKTLQNMFYYVD